MYDANDKALRPVKPREYATPMSNGWYWVLVPLEALGAKRSALSGVAFQDATGAAQDTYYVDQPQFSAGNATLQATRSASMAG